MIEERNKQIILIVSIVAIIGLVFTFIDSSGSLIGQKGFVPKAGLRESTDWENFKEFILREEWNRPRGNERSTTRSGGGGGITPPILTTPRGTEPGRSFNECGMFCDSSGDQDIDVEDWSPGIGCVMYEPLIDTGSGGWSDDAGSLCNTDEATQYCPSGTNDCWHSTYPGWDQEYDGDEWPDASCCTQCGDGSIDGNEVCDPGGSTYDPEINSYYPYDENLNGETCATQISGDFEGDLNCLSDCSGYDTTACTKINGAACSSDSECTNEACNTDYDQSGTFCASGSNYCVYDSVTGGNAEEFSIADGYEQCEEDGYRTCNTGSWSDYNDCADGSCTDDGDGTYTSISDSICSSGSSGECPSQTTTDCGAYTCTTDFCRTSCSSDSECISGHVCISGSCMIEGYDGCTNETACNYDVDATSDDGSCEVDDACNVCGGNHQDSNEYWPPDIYSDMCDCDAGWCTAGGGNGFNIDEDYCEGNSFPVIVLNTDPNHILGLDIGDPTGECRCACGCSNLYTGNSLLDCTGQGPEIGCTNAFPCSGSPLFNVDSCGECCGYESC